MAKLEIKIEGFELRAEGEAAFAALRSFLGGIARAAGNCAHHGEAEAEEEGEEEPEEPEEPEEEEEPEAASEEAEGDNEEEGEEEAVGVTESAMKVIQSEANKAGGKGVWFQPPAISDMAMRAGISVDQFRSSFAYLKKNGRIECDSAATSRPKPIRVPLDEGDE